MLRSLFLLLTVVALCLVVVDAGQPSNHGLSTTFTTSDATSLKTFLQSKDLTNIHDAFYATQALANLDSKPTKITEICNLAKDTLKSKDVFEKLDAESLYHAASVAQTLKCDVTLEKGFADAIKSILEDGDVPHYYHAVLAALALRDQTKKSIPEGELLAVIDKIGDLTEDDGTVRSSTSDKDGTLYNAGLALELYARLQSTFTLSDTDVEHVDNLADKTEALFDLANEGDGTLSFSSEGDGQSTLATTAHIVEGLESLGVSSKKKLAITPIQLAQLGEYFLSHKHASTLEDAYYLLLGLRAVQDSPKSPLALTIEKSSILSTAKGAEGSIKVKLSDIFDNVVPGKIFLVKSHSVGKPDTILLANQEVTDALNFLAAKPEQGFYALEFRAVPTNTEKYATIDSAARRVKVIGSISVTDFELFVSDSKEQRSEGSTYKAEFPNKIDEQIQVLPSQFIHAQFKVRNAGGSTSRPLVAQQAFLRFVHKSGHEAVFVATPNDNKVYSVVINVADSARSQFLSLSGDYVLEVVVGDAFVQNPIHWVVSNSVSFTFSEKAAPRTNPLAAKPEIKHVFRTPEKRPSSVISSAFTLATLAPLLFLFSGFLALGANIRKFPTGTDFFSAVGFVASIGLILALIAFYWLKLNLIQTLGYLFVLAIPALFFGQRALSSLAKKE